MLLARLPAGATLLVLGVASTGLEVLVVKLAGIHGCVSGGNVYVSTEGKMQVFVGLVVRDHLMVLLRRALARGTTANLDVTYEDLNHQFVTAAARHLIWEQHMAVLQVGMPGMN